MLLRLDAFWAAALYEPSALLRVASQEQLCGALGEPADQPSLPARGLWRALDEARKNPGLRPVPAPLPLAALLALLLTGACGDALRAGDCDDVDTLCCIEAEGELADMLPQPAARQQLWAAIQLHKAGGAGGGGGEGAQQVV